ELYGFPAHAAPANSVASDPAGFVIIGICYVDSYCCAIRLAWPHVSRLVEVPWRQRSRGRPGFIRADRAEVGAGRIRYIHRGCVRPSLRFSGIDCGGRVLT